MSFAIFKVVSGFVVTLIFLKYLLKFLETNIYSFIKMTLLQMAFPIISQLIFLLFVKEFLPFEEGTFNLIIIITCGGFSALIGATLLFFTSKYYKNVLSLNKLYI